MTGERFRIGSVPVPALAVGAMYFGTRVPAAQSAACLDAAYDLGARFWDTANNYAFWAGGVGDESEQAIGAWLASRGPAVREQITLATKAGARPRVPGADLDDALGLSRRAIETQVEDSLRRLRTDYLDILYAHIDDRDTPFVETLTVFADLVDAGKVRAVAASNLTLPRLEEAVRVDAPIHYQALQQRFSYLVPNPGADLTPHVLLDDDISRVCEEHGLTRLGYSALLSGAYTRADAPYPEGYAPTETALGPLHETAQAHGLDAAQAVLAWMVARTEPVLPIVGVSRPEQVTAAWDAVSTPLTPEETQRLDEARRD